MNINEMRNYISDKYPGKKWKHRVRYMPDNQVIAIYHSMIKREEKLRLAAQLDKVEHQMTIWEIMNEAQ